ncbi:MAG: PIN domain-containing protein [Gammaproteobacteria bacterium]|nr:PIN domain-containing protein [Gammaproteobacteria bacterium]
MKSIILDCSATLAWLMPDESWPEGELLLDEIVENGAYVPNLWSLEIANSLLIAVTRKRITHEMRLNLLSSLKDLPIEVDSSTSDYAFNKISTIAQEHELTAYDASYIELAVRLKGTLATLDKALIKAASKMKVPLY